MAKHSGGKLTQAAKNLAAKNTTKKQKSEAGKALQKHKEEKH